MLSFGLVGKRGHKLQPFLPLPTVGSINIPPHSVLMGHAGTLSPTLQWERLTLLAVHLDLSADTCNLDVSLQHCVPRSGRPRKEQGIHISGPLACHLPATLRPMFLMGLVFLYRKPWACHLCCRGQNCLSLLRLSK